MLKIAVGSKNPAKLNAVQAAFQTMGYEVQVIGLNVPSGVSAQPFSDEETMKGAIQRASSVFELQGDLTFDFGIGLEGGVVETAYGLFLCNWGAVISKTGEMGVGGGHRVQLPDEIAKELYEGKELGDIIDRFVQGKDIKKKEGTIGILTNNHITRQKMFHDVVICSFSRFMF